MYQLPLVQKLIDVDWCSLMQRIRLFSVLFIPDATHPSNLLGNIIKEPPSLGIFKSKLKVKYKAPVAPYYFYSGDRRTSVLNAIPRNNCSNLNNDLFINHLQDNPMCNCGQGSEDTNIISLLVVIILPSA